MGKIYIVCETSTEIRVYNGKTFNEEKSIHVAEIIEPNDITAHDGCLYILDKLHIILLHLEPYKVEEWLPIVNKGYRKLSITSDGCLVMLGKNDIGNVTRIVKYNPAPATSIRATINLEDLHLPCPRHALEIEPDKFIVSYGKNTSDHGICIFTYTNDLITERILVWNRPTVTSKEDERTENESLLISNNNVIKENNDVRNENEDMNADNDSVKNPCYLAKDDAENVFVADTGNCQVVIMDRNRKTKDVIRYDETFKPIRLWFHTEEGVNKTGLLIVGQMQGYLDIYSVNL